MFDEMTGSKIKCLGVPEPNNEMRFGFYVLPPFWLLVEGFTENLAMLITQNHE